MATGRTTTNWRRLYVNGIDLSAHMRNIGPLSQTYEEGIDDCVTRTIKGTWASRASISPGTLNALFDNTATTGSHIVLPSLVGGGDANVMVPIGIQGAPTAGDPVYMGAFPIQSYEAGESEKMVAATVKFGSARGVTELDYSLPWGVLLHENSAATTDNAADGIGNPLGTSTLFGGYMAYHIFAAAGTTTMTATIRVDDGDTAGGAFSSLLTTGSLALGSGGTFSGPVSGYVALAKGATVKAFTRWQIAWGNATSVTFALAFVRGYF
jgi:hypothetical protein